MGLRLSILTVVLAVVLAVVSFGALAQEAGSNQSKSFETKMRAVDAVTLVAGKVKVVLWGVRSVNGMPVLLAEKSRVKLDDAIGNNPVQCELKKRFENHLLAQCVNSSDQDLGLLMLQNGYASVDHANIYGSVFEQPYLQAQKEAQDDERGIWKAEMDAAQGGFNASWIMVMAVLLLFSVIAAFGVLSIIIMRGFQKVIDAQNKNIDMLGRERQIKNKERAVVASMLDSEIKANKSKIEAYLTVYEEMLSDMKNPQRQPKYKKTGDIVQTQPALDRAVFDRNTDKLEALGDKLSSEVIHFYARIKTKPDYINLEPDTPLEEATAMVGKGIENAKRMNKIADALIDAFDHGGLSAEAMQD